MDELIYDRWIPCADAEYFQTDDDIVFVPPVSEEDRYLYFGSRRDCPYGWNILVRANASFMTVKFPENGSTDE